ncbi:Protein-hormone receptor [Mactra antiquata]
MQKTSFKLWNYLFYCYIMIVSCMADDVRCREECQCIFNNINGYSVDCTAGNLTSIPTGLDSNILQLDLSLNPLSSLPDRAFSTLTSLIKLHLVSINISRLSDGVFYGLTKLEELSLQGNSLRTVPRDALRNLPSLKVLYLDNNKIATVPDNSFNSLPHLVNLRLDQNKLTQVPVVALTKTSNLVGLNLEGNLITTIPDYAFANLTNVEVLILSKNRISRIGNNAFDGLQVLKLLILNHNQLKKIPVALHALPDLVHLHINSNQITYLEDDCFAVNKKLSLIVLKGNPIQSFANNTFSYMPALETLVLSEVHDLTVFPNLEGTYMLETITLDRASIKELPPTPCKNMHYLKVFDVHSNQISAIPNMTGCSMLTSLYLGNNEITSIEGSQFLGLSKLQDLILSFNKISYISDTAFIGLTDLRYLDLSFNRITVIHTNAFVPVSRLEDLNVAENQFKHLPTDGLQKLRYLKTFHNTNLQEPLSFEAFPHIVSLKLAYAYHCCAFIRRDKSREKNVMPKIKEEVITYLQYNDPPDSNFSEYDIANYNFDDDYNLNKTDLLDYGNESNGSGKTKEGTYPGGIKQMIQFKPPIDCEPLPDPFRPCDDLFGWWSLRCGVWIVFLLAVIGNGTVLFVSVTSKSKLDVTRFLICNLAMSDFCMGIYLGFMAVMDASTLGVFEIHAIYWQTGAGCMIAGFLGVLSSELSVFTLVVITIERFYAISHAMQLGKRIRLGQAAIVMACGWIISLTIASLPLFKVSDFRKFAVCLPFDTEDNLSLAYVCFIMVYNAISFIIILACYAGMFVSIRASHTWNSKDTVVAKRMSLLVFTDFFCWAPIIFFSLTAAFNWDFVKISLDEAKVLTIFVLPLNSCANPFLYAFFTRQFKRDCVKLCKRIEESSITRHFSSSGVGRSSAVSHRHHQNNSCSDKRRSCDNSVNEPSTSGEASSSNNPSDDSDLTVRKLPLTHEERQILRYMRADGSAVRLTSPRLLSPVELSSPEVEQTVEFRRRLNVEPKLVKLSPMRRSDMESESMHDIVLHTKEGNVYLSAKPKSVKNFRRRERLRSLGSEKCAQRLSNYALRPVEQSRSPSADIRSVQSQTAETNVDSQEPSPTEPVNTEAVVEDKARRKFEAERSKELGLKIQPSFKTKSKQTKTMVEEGSPQKTVSTQTEMLLPLRRPWQSEIAANISKREKEKHINEWRKTSHLSFLWRNSGTFDGIHQKQKSNSLVELTRPLSNWNNTTTKRHSLTSKHEGYILLRNSSRDSAYGDEEMYEFYDSNIQEVHRPTSTKGNKKKHKHIKQSSTNMMNSSESEGLCETDGLLIHADNKVIDNLGIPKGRNSCDIESGISSSS